MNATQKRKVSLAIYSVGGGGIQGDERAAYWYQKAAERGDANAQANLGRALFRLGRFSEAYEWMKLAIVRLTGDAQREAANDLRIFAARLTPEELSRTGSSK
jgi:TPR repeat protein